MHIPDNYLSPSTCAVLGTAMLPVWSKAVNKVKQEISRKKMPLLGICSAFSFLIMMFNVPLPGGTSGHAAGATLIAILLGPFSAVISVTIALAIQALFFGDGGVLAFGANSFNMAFLMPFVGYFCYRFIKARIKNDKGEYIAAFIGSYLGICAAAFAAAVEFGIQPILFKDSLGAPLYCPYPLSVSIPAMVIPHMLVVGFIEAFVTIGVYAYVKKVSPGIIYEDVNVRSKPIYSLLVILILLSPVGLLARGTAWGEWGLDEIKSKFGYIPGGMKSGFSFSSLMPDYGVKGSPEIIGYIISALAGVAIILIIFKVVNSFKNQQNN